MAREVVNPILGTRMKAARAQSGLSQGAVADRVGGIGQTAVSEIENGRVLKPDNLEDFARVLSVPAEWLMGEGPSTIPDRKPPPAPNASSPKFAQMIVSKSIPVFGHAAGSDNGRFIMNGQKLADVFCPPSLENVEGAYAVYVYGDSMSPRYEAGETVWLHPYLPVRRNDYVVAQVRSPHSAEGEAPDAFVKKFVSKTERDGLVLEQLNPPNEEERIMRFPSRDVFSVHRIVFSGTS